MKAILLLHLALLPLAFSGSGEPTPGGEVPPPTIEVTLQNSQNHIVAKCVHRDQAFAVSSACPTSTKCSENPSFHYTDFCKLCDEKTTDYSTPYCCWTDRLLSGIRYCNALKDIVRLKRGGKEVAWCYGTSIELSKWNLDRSKVSSCAPTYPFSFDDVTCDMVDSQVPDAEWLAIKSLKASTGARVSCREKDSQCCGDDGIQNKC